MQKRFEKLYHASYDTEKIPFAAVLTNRKALPVKCLKELMQEIVDGDDIEPFWCCDPQGTERLRNCLVEMLFSRHIYVKAYNIQIVSETYEAISNIAFMYLNKGDYVIIEEPACPAIANIFLHVGAKLLSVPIEDNGIRMDILEGYVLQYKPKLIYTMPNYQNPSTHTMEMDNRKRLLKCAGAYNIPIIEDDSQYDYCYSETRFPSLYSLDTSDSVIYLDTAGLSIYPGIRLAYILAPDNVLKTYRSIVNKDQLFLNSMGQYLWMRFLEKGFYETHFKFLKEFYNRKREIMCTELSKIPEISFLKPDGGLVIWVKMERNINDFQVAALCEKMGVLLMPGSIFFPEGNKGENYLRISFSSATDEQIIKGAEVLQKAILICMQDNAEK
nr:PLP-dependent aminotransferase family protein [Hespellia stercorisuis]